MLFSNQSLRLLVVSLVLASQMSSPFWISIAHAESVKVLTQAPDDVDYQNYYNYYKTALDASDQARVKSDKTKKSAETYDASTALKTSQFQSKDNQLATNSSEQGRLESSNYDLRARMAVLDREILDLENKIKPQEAKVLSLTTTANALHAIQVKAEGDFTNANNYFLGVDRQLSDAIAKLNTAVNQLAIIRDQTERLRQEQAQINYDLPIAQNFQRAKTAELAGMQAAQSRLNQDVASKEATKASADAANATAAANNAADLAAERTAEASRVSAQAVNSRAQVAVDAKQLEVTKLIATKTAAENASAAAKVDAARLSIELKAAKFDQANAKAELDKAVAANAAPAVLQPLQVALAAADNAVISLQTRLDIKNNEISNQAETAKATQVLIDSKNLEKAPLDTALANAVVALRTAETAKASAVAASALSTDALKLTKSAATNAAGSLTASVGVRDANQRELNRVAREQARYTNDMNVMIDRLRQIQLDWRVLHDRDESWSIERARAENNKNQLIGPRNDALAIRNSAEYDKNQAVAKYLASYAEFDHENKILANLKVEEAPKVAEDTRDVAQVKAQENRIVVIVAENKLLKTDSDALKIEVADLKALSLAAWGNYGAQNTEASRLEAITAVKLADYNKRAEKYATKLAEAQAFGAAKGIEVGNVDALVASKADGARVGLQEGEISGTRQGKEYGYKLGQNNGDSAGEKAGNKYGLELPSNYAAGNSRGLEDGRNNGKAAAERLDYPQARKDYRKARLAVQISKTVDLVAGQAVAGPIGGFLPTRDGLLEERGVRNASFAVDRKSLPSEVKNDLTVGIAKPSSNSDDPKLKEYLKAYTVDLGKVDCSGNTYQAYEVFVKACQDSFSSSYSGKYEAVYKVQYPIQKGLSFEEARGLAFEAHKKDREQEGYDLTYGPAFKRGTALGAAEAQADGYMTGQLEGYTEQFGTQDQPGPARKEAYVRGETDETEYFKNNPVIRLKGVEAVRLNRQGEKEGFLPSDQIQLRAKLANYGDVEAPQGSVKLKWQAVSNNVSAEEGFKDLPAVTDRVNANVSGLSTAQLGQKMGGFENFTLRVTALLPTGETQMMDLPLQTGELFIFSDIFSQTELKVKPVYYNFFTKKFRVQKVSVLVNNDTLFQAEKPFTVSLTTDARSGVVLDSKATGSTRILGARESETVDLYYTFNEEVKTLYATGINLKVTVMYGDRQSAKQDIKVDLIK